MSQVTMTKCDLCEGLFRLPPNSEPRTCVIEITGTLEQARFEFICAVCAHHVSEAVVSAIATRRGTLVYCVVLTDELVLTRESEVTT